MRTRDTRVSGTNLGTARSAKQWRDSFARLPNSRVMASWTVLHARRIAVVTPSRFRRGAAATVPWSTALENESSRKILYPPDPDPFRRTREWCKEAQGVAGAPSRGARRTETAEGREEVGFTGIPSKCPMNERWALGPTIHPVLASRLPPLLLPYVRHPLRIRIGFQVGVSYAPWNCD